MGAHYYIIYYILCRCIVTTIEGRFVRFREPNHNSRSIQSSYTTKSTTNSLRPVPRELKFDSPSHRMREVSPAYKKIVETTTHKNVNYDPCESIKAAEVPKRII